MSVSRVESRSRSVLTENVCEVITGRPSSASRAPGIGSQYPVESHQIEATRPWHESLHLRHCMSSRVYNDTADAASPDLSGSLVHPDGIAARTRFDSNRVRLSQDPH
jgi:hypothetical protein